MKFTRVGDADICYEVAGTGPAVLCVQGVGVAGRGWRPQVNALAGRFTMISFDNRGLGRSSTGRDLLSIEAMAADAVAVMDAEGIDRFHLVGHSMGGLIAQHIALTVRPRVKSLALLCTFANGKDATALSFRIAILGLRTRIGTRTMRRNGMLRMILPPDYLRGADRASLAQDFQDIFGRDLADQPPIVMNQMRAMSHYAATSRLRELSGVPTLVASGAHDPIAPPRLGRALAAGIEGARFVEFPDASHALPIQCADEMNRLLLNHLTSSDPGGPAVDRDPFRSTIG